tara:strand:- start:1257 stop:1463 length:207 start_codon:yes stop_codon:yes gene_type:complete
MTMIDGGMKLVIHDQRKGALASELFDLQTDPAETMNLIEQKPAIAEELGQKLGAWQTSVLQSLTGADY